jgi:Type IV secretion-system coupling protein DNA-binding domain
MWLEHLTSSALNHLFTGRQTHTPEGIALGRRVDPPHDAVVFPNRSRTQHLVMVGKTGFGKTHALELVATSIAARGEGFAFFDFHGDASLSLIGRLLPLRDATQHLVVLDPSHPTRSPSINVLESGRSEAERFRKVSELSSILRQRWGVDSFGARTEELLRNSLYTLAAAHRPLADLPHLLTDSGHRRTLTEEVDHPDIQTYWRDRYEPLSDAMKAAFREPLLNRVTAFLTEPAARHLLAQSDSTIEVARVMAEQQWLIIRLPKGRLREHAHTLGNLLFAQLQFAAMARDAVPTRLRRTFTLLCDEVQNLAENDLSTLISESRKFSISVITANQFWEQLPKELRGALLSAGSHMCFRVSSADAPILASELSLEHRQRLTVDLTHLERGEAIGRFGPEPVVRFRVSALPRSAPAKNADLDALVTPVTRLRSEIEDGLRRSTRSKSIDNLPVRDSAHVDEGHHGW